MTTTNPQDQLVQSLRERLLEGRYVANQKLTEAALAAELGVSRTLVRLALAGLEHEGLVTREPNRGFRVRAYTLEEVGDAIAVRGELEAMAARLAAENGMAVSDQSAMRQHLSRMDQVLVNGLQDVESRALWIELNGHFHAMLLDSAQNNTLREMVDDLGKIPLVSAKAIVFDSIDRQHSLTSIQLAHQDHHSVFDAIVSRQGSRAAAIMREHTERSRANKRASFASMSRSGYQPALPGLRLVSDQ